MQPPFFWKKKQSSLIRKLRLNPPIKKGNKNFKRFLVEQKFNDIDLDNNKFKNRNYAPKKYINIIRGIKNVKRQNKEYV